MPRSLPAKHLTNAFQELMNQKTRENTCERLVAILFELLEETEKFNDTIHFEANLCTAETICSLAHANGFESFGTLADTYFQARAQIAKMHNRPPPPRAFYRILPMSFQ